MHTDIHTHILPDVDDGARSMNDALNMLSAAKAAGVERIVATPHIYHLNHDDTKIINAYQEVRRRAAERDIDMRLGFELNWRAIVSRDWRAIRARAVEGTDCVLLELPNRAPFPNCLAVITEMCRHMTVLLVHPERYRYFQKDIALIDKFKEAGCEVQIDAFSLVGNPFSAETRFSRRLLKTGRVDYIASDAHSAPEYKLYARALERFADILPTRDIFTPRDERGSASK